MNFLAHFYLSENKPKIIVGNFLGDFITRKQRENIEQEILQGVFLHYAIDDFTDRHHLVKQGRETLFAHFGKYAAVITDVYLDYFLAKKWQSFCKTPLPEFAEMVYTTLETHQELFDLKAKMTYEHMRKNNWLTNYAKREGIERTMQGLSQRANHENKVFDAAAYLFDNEFFWENIFDRFFPELEIFCAESLRKIISEKF